METVEASGLGNAVGSVLAIGLFFARVIGIILGLYLIRPSKRAEIVELWKAKWSIPEV
ncbi:MAG: hypothetical protein K6F34_00745 [Lachnospiraceae bacterium]|nr:hypothetical protein [Lachnospiraceae bacterium]